MKLEELVSGEEAVVICSFIDMAEAIYDKCSSISSSREEAIALTYSTIGLLIIHKIK